MKQLRLLLAAGLLLLGLPFPAAWAAISATTVWEVRVPGADTNGGGFKAGASGTDYSQQDSKNTVGSNISTVDAVANGTTTITSATAAFTTAITGNDIYLAGGSGSLTGGWYEATYVSATSITVDRTVAAGTGITLNIGGALASPGQLGANMVAGNDFYIKAGTYTVTSASTNVSGGCLSLPAGASAANIVKGAGYQTTRGDGGTKPLLQASGISTFSLITTAAGNHVENLSVDGAGLTSSKGFNLAAGAAQAYRCKAANCTNSGYVGNSIALTGLYLCEATGCSTAAAFSVGSAFGCTAHDNTVTGFMGCSATLSIACNNSGASSDGFNNNTNNALFIGDTSYGNGRDGFRFTTVQAQCACVNCISEGNAGWQYNASAAMDMVYLYNCAGKADGSGLVNATTIAASQQIGLVTCTAEIFVAAGSNNFALNTTAGGGAACRAAGILGAFPGLSTTGYADIGAVQHQDSGGAGHQRRVQ
jgi:hypothetical protein